MEKRNNAKRKIFLFVFEGFSDWEPSYAMAEINKSGKYDVETFAVSAAPVQSAGGLKILPSSTVYNISLQNAAMLILPGGEPLQKNKYREVLTVIENAYAAGIPVAAICSATTLLADLGMLDDTRHTSNSLSYLQRFSGWYKGEEFYVDERVVTDNNIITAGGVYPVEFAMEILTLLDIYGEDKIEKWYQLFENGVWAQ